MGGSGEAGPESGGAARVSSVTGTVPSRGSTRLGKAGPRGGAGGDGRVTSGLACSVTALRHHTVRDERCDAIGSALKSDTHPAPRAPRTARTCCLRVCDDSLLTEPGRAGGPLHGAGGPPSPSRPLALGASVGGNRWRGARGYRAGRRAHPSG